MKLQDVCQALLSKMFPFIRQFQEHISPIPIAITRILAFEYKQFVATDKVGLMQAKGK